MLEALAVLAGLVGWREYISYRDRRAVEAERKAERAEWTDERTALLNRIKPETAQPTRLPESIELPQREPETDYLTETGDLFGGVNGGS